MQKRKSFLVVLVALLACLVFAGCSSNGSGQKNAGAIAKEDLKIGVIHIGDPGDGSGYSFTHDQGIVGMQKSLGLKDEQIYRVLNTSETSATRTAIEDCVNHGCNVVFGTSYDHMEAMTGIVDQYPNVYFANATGSESNDYNFINYYGRAYQARYLSGIAAGLKTKSNKIGFVAAFGKELAETGSAINAFAMGVQAVNPTAEVLVKTTNSWYDPANEKASAEALIAMGCDVIAQHCDTVQPQLAAQEKGVFGVGYDSDMSKEAPAAELTSVIFHWDVFYTTAVQAAIDGKWIEMGNYFGGLADNFVDITPLTGLCEAGTQEKIDQVKDLILSGDWDVFSGEKLSFGDDGKLVRTKADLKDNEGNVVVKAGDKSIEDDVIKFTMNYYVEGVSQK